LYFAISSIPFVIIIILALYAIYQVFGMYSVFDSLMNNFVRPLLGWCWYLTWYGFLILLCSILVNTAIALGYFLYESIIKGPQKTNFHPIELLGLMLVICGVVYYFGYPKIFLMIAVAEIPIILIVLLVRKRDRDANRQVYKTDWRAARETNRQAQKADWKLDSRKQHWTERNSLKKSMKKVAYKFPSYRH